MTLSSCDSQSCGNMTFKLYTIDMVAQTGVDIGVTEWKMRDKTTL